MKSLFDLGHNCAKLGLFPVAIEPDHVDIVIEYLNELELDFTAKAVVPLGYDWTCHKDGNTSGKCEKSFNSFDSPQSKDITEVLMSKID